jgi:hypothetical protein
MNLVLLGKWRWKIISSGDDRNFCSVFSIFFLNGKYIIINIQVSAKAKRSLLPKQTKNFFLKKQRNRTKKIKNKTASK